MALKLPIPAKLPSLSGRERLLGTLGALAVAAVLMDRLALGPWLRHMHRVEQEIAALERSIATNNQLLNRKEVVLAQIGAYQSVLRMAGPKETEIAGLLREIESLGGESGVTLGEVKPLPTEDGGRYQVRRFDVQCEGTVPEVVRFLYMLQTSPSLFTVDQATLEVKESGSTLAKSTIRLTSMAITAPAGRTGTEADATTAEAEEPST